MDISTGSWFEYLNEEARLDEGVRDIGLPDLVAQSIENSLHDADEKAKVWMGKEWKESTYDTATTHRTHLLFNTINFLIDEYGEFQSDSRVSRKRVERTKSLELDPERFSGPHLHPERGLVPREGLTREELVRRLLTEETGEEEPIRTDVNPAAIAAWRKVKFIIKNVRDAIKDERMGKWKKAFKKAVRALHKIEFGTEEARKNKAEKTAEFLSGVIRDGWENFRRKYEEVFAFLNDHPSNYDEIRELDIREAELEAAAYLEAKEDPENIIHTFDDGSYWYNLNVSNCSIEAERMGHCGGDSRGMLVSLRKPKKGRKIESSSYVTMAWNEGDGILYQIKGRGNSPAPEETWPAISWFVANQRVHQVLEEGEYAGNDEGFEKLNAYLKKENPGLYIPDNMREKMEEAETDARRLLGQYGDGGALDNSILDINVINPREEWGEDAADSPVFEASAVLNLQIPLGWENYKFDPRTSTNFIAVKAFETRKGDVKRRRGISRDEPITDDERYKSIPKGDPTWGYGDDTQEFLEISGLEEFKDDLPGDERTIGYDLDVLEPFVPGWEMGDREPDKIAFLAVEIVCKIEDAITDIHDVEWFFDQIVDDFEDKYRAVVEKVRSNLAEAGYAARTAWDQQKTSLEDVVLSKPSDTKNFDLFEPDRAHLEFWFTDPDVPPRPGSVTGIYEIKVPTKLSPSAFIYWPYLAATGQRQMGTIQAGPRPAWQFLHKLFGAGDFRARGAGDGPGGGFTRTVRMNRNEAFTNEKLNKSLQHQLIALNRHAIMAARSGQEELPYGDKYKRQAPPKLDVARDVRLIIHHAGISMADKPMLTGLGLNYQVRVGISSADTEEEMERVKEFVEFLNDNAHMVKEAAEEVIMVEIIEPINEYAENTKKFIVDGALLGFASRQIEHTFQADADKGHQIPEKMILIKDWINANWDRMSDLERYVAVIEFLQPMSKPERAEFPYQASTIHYQPESKLGMPEHNPDWVQLVKHEMYARGYSNDVAQKYTEPVTGAPRKVLGIEDPPPEMDPQAVSNWTSPLGRASRQRAGREGPGGIQAPLNPPVQAESIEDQIERVDKLLTEKDPLYDLRIYKIRVNCGISRDRGGEVQEVQTEIRGVEGVTTVRSLGETVRETPHQIFVTMEIKFELLGSIGRVKYRDRVLIPGMMKVKGLSVLGLTPIHRINVKGSIRTVRESFGGSGPTGFMPQQDAVQKMETPRSSLEDALQDWVQGSVMAYDVAVNSRDMRYTVMLPVKELLPYISREFRAPMDAFDGMYQHFIQHGAQAPVYVALGKNGRIKITGNEDIVWFAKRSGLKEVPVFISYQRQA